MRRGKVLRARELRANQTPAERKAWELLRNRRCLGYKFRRQQVLYGLIVDFYCSELNLAIELDGQVHASIDRQEYDLARDSVLHDAGIRVVRMPNSEVCQSRLVALIRTFQA